MGEQERRDKNSLRAHPHGSGSNTAPSLPSLLERASFWVQLRSRAENTRETLHPSHHSGGTERGSELPQMHSNVLAKEGLVSRNEGIHKKKKKNRLENSRRERSR